MIFSIIAGVLIFGYAGFTLYRFVKRSKMGKCAGCALSKNCSSACSSSTPPVPLKNNVKNNIKAENQ
ncbi:FeoB-associated Cys-rich membrane protein [Sporosarcina koreensis]|uniref:FeoB-associated Cys-rich membrane protein n=1 Tax=Sporosarcina koreensis TaxID=334735 RepID=A0ABW0U4M6_9BACL